MPSLVRANIFQRKTRAAITIFAVAVEVAAVMLIVGFTRGTVNEVADRIQAVGADLVVQAATSSAVLGFSDVAIPGQIVDMLLEMEDVADAAPVLSQSTSDIGAAPNQIWGIDPNRFGNRLVVEEGRLFTGGYEMVVDRRLATANDLVVGQQIRMLNNEWNLVGIIEPGVGVRVFVPLATLQDLLGLGDRIHFVFVDARDPELAGALAQQIERELPGHVATPLGNYREALFENVAMLDQFNAAMSSTAVVLSFLVILLAMYTSIVERTREIGILKALGASKPYIMRAILSEALLLCSLGAVGGYGLAYLGREMLLSRFETLNVEFTAEWMIYAGLLGLVGGLLGSVYPALRAARQDAVRALRYE